MTHALLMAEAVQNLAAAVSNALLYAPEHPQVVRHATRGAERLAAILEKTGETELVAVDDILFHDGKPLEKSLFGRRLAQAMKGRGIGFFRFLRGVSAGELVQVAAFLCGKTDAAMPPHVRFGKVALDRKGGTGDLEIASFDGIPADHLQSLAATFDAARRNEEITLAGLAALVAGFLNAFRRAANPLLALAPIRAMDEYTFAHSVNVGILNIAQAISLGMEGELLHDAGMAGMLHDAGKLAVPKEILQKEEALKEEEWRVLKEHPVRGAEYLLNQAGIPRLAVIAAYEHHLRHDLSGYPKVPAGWKPNMLSEMTMISDCFDALRTKRVYQDPSDFEKTAGIMLGFAGTRLHRGLTFNFLRLLGEMGRKIGDGGAILRSA